MKVSQSSNFLRNERLQEGFLFVFVSIWAYFCYTNWISDSEFWPVTLSGHWDQWRDNPALIYKAVFHASLSWIYALDLDSVTHLKVAKAFYAVLGGVSFLFFYKILKREIDSLKAVIVTLIFLLSNLGFSQIGVIRSDFLSFLVFEVALYLLLQIEPYRWKKVGLYFIFFSAFLFLCTPKSIYFIILLFVSLGLYIPKGFRMKYVNLLLGAACLCATILFLWSKYNNAFLSAFNWGLESQQASHEKFFRSRVISYLANDMHLVVLLISGLLLQTVSILRNQQRQEALYWTVFGIGSFLILVFHRPLLPFFMGSYWGLFFLSLIPTLKKCSTRLLISLFLITGIVFGFRYSLQYHYPNQIQMETISSVESIVKSIPNGRMFDGLGVAPRVSQVMSYLGPDDRVSTIFIFASVVSLKPEFIITNHRWLLIDADKNSFLIENYNSVGMGYWLRKDQKMKVNIPKFKSAFHVFGFEPAPEMLKY